MSLYLVRQIKLNQQDLIKSEEARREIETLLKFDAEKNAIKQGQLAIPYPTLRISIEITDPIGLARREQPFTKYLSQVSPNLIIKKVYEQVAKEVEEGLKEQHVDAEIKIETR